MTKKLKNVDVIEFDEYTVVLERIKNATSGAPRYEAIIIYTGPDRGKERSGYKYRFSGHYSSERKEAEFVLNRYLEENA